MEIIVLIIVLAIVVLWYVGLWKIAEKAGRQGWEGIVPIYNRCIFAELGGKPMWWGALTLIPYAGIIFQIWIYNRLVKSFGKNEAFTIGMVLLPFIFAPVLGFGDAQYTRPSGNATPAPTPAPSPAPTPTPEVSAPDASAPDASTTEENSDDENTSTE